MNRLLLLAFLTVVAAPLAAQTDQERWRDSYYPIISYSGNDGVTLGFRYIWTQRASFDAPYFFKGALITDVNASASGSYGAGVRFKAPGLRHNWRFDLSASLARQTRYAFYGLGEHTTYHADSVNSGQRYYYKVRRAQRQVKGEVSRRLVGRWWLTGMAQWKHTEFTDPPGPSIFTDAFASPLTETDLVGRVGLVYDSRDNDFDTHQGFLLDAGMIHGTGDGDGYDRWVMEARAWVPFGEWRSTWLSIRAVASAATGDLPLDARLYLPVWEGQVRVLGGSESQRGLLDQRYVGRDLLFGNVTLNHDLFNAGAFGAGGVSAFADVGRVFEDDKFSLTTDGMKFGAGAGFYFRFLQTGVYTFNFAKGPDGFVFTLGNSWMF